MSMATGFNLDGFFRALGVGIIITALTGTAVGLTIIFAILHLIGVV